MTKIKNGDKARIKKTGEVFTVEDVNPNWFDGPECDECYIEGWHAHGSVTIDHPDEIEKVDWQEPTNTERLEQLIRESDFKVSGYFGFHSIGVFAEYLDEHGVTAPNVKDN